MLNHVTLPRIGAIETILKELSPSSAIAVDNGTMCCDSNVVLSCKLLMPVGSLPARRRPQGLVVIGVCLSVCLCALMGDVGHGQRAGLCPPRTQ